jgi:hypothetical protein
MIGKLVVVSRACLVVPPGKIYIFVEISYIAQVILIVSGVNSPQLSARP